MSAPLRERVSVPVERASLSVVPRGRPRFDPRVALAGIYAVAVAYHWLQSRAHVSPVVFGDELLYSKLAQSLVAGDGFSIRGETVLFPAPLAPLLQSPFWLLPSTATAFAAIKVFNTAVMCSAAVPAYWLARRLATPRLALIAAASTVAAPGLIYAPYLMSEAVAYPVFLLAVATYVRAVEQPSRRMEAAVVGVSLLACSARVQFLVLPVAYLLVVAFRRTVGLHRLSVIGLAAAVAPAVATGVTVGTYGSTAGFDAARTLSWTALTAALLPFGAGWLIVPGAVLGLVAVRRSAFALLTIWLAALTFAEVAFVAGDAGRPLERYTIYLVPLLAVAFAAYVERGAPWRKAYVAIALAGGATAWLVPFPSKVLTPFTFDAPTFSAYARVEAWWGTANAATLFAVLPLLAGIALAVLPLRRFGVAVGIGAVALLVVSGIPALDADHATARGALRERAGSPPDWLDRSKLGRADYVQLPGGSAHTGWLLEAWNRDFGRSLHFEGNGDWFASSKVTVAPDGRLLADGAPLRAGVLVVEDAGTRIELEGSVVARPRAGLVAFRIPDAPRVHGLAEGLAPDGWATGVVRYRAWSTRPGAYRVRLALPVGYDRREIVLSLEGRGPVRRLTLLPGTSRSLEIPTHGTPPPPLTIAADHATESADSRLVAVRIPTLEFEAKP